MDLTTARDWPSGAPAAAPKAATPEWPSRLKIAVLIPCYNEEVAISEVVADFRAALPGVPIYVYDNNSRDQTMAVARDAGAIVRSERLQGKGHVVRRMFADIEADVYILVDGDNTYDVAMAPAMLRKLCEEQLDMLTGVRVTAVNSAYRRGHRLGNRVLTGIISQIFGNRISDMLSGYRVFSRRFVKSFPALSSGFEIETEFAVHALEQNMPLGEVQTAYKERPLGSASKLRTYVDGLRILRTIVILVKEERPLQFFCLAGATLLMCGVGFGTPIITEYLRTHLVPRLPTALLATALVLLAFLSMTSGFILDSVTRGRKEMKRLAYLSVPVIDAQIRVGVGCTRNVAR
jgi:hypothetical protein